MNISKILAGLLTALLLTLVAFAVVMGFSLLVSSLGDILAAQVLGWVGGGLGIVMVVELVALIVVMAVRMTLGNDRIDEHGRQA